MIKGIRKIQVCITLGGLLAATILLQVMLPIVVKELYEANLTGLLNGLTFSEGNHSVGFYQGQILNLYLGPLHTLFSVCLFLWFALKNLKEVNTHIFAFSVFVFFLLSKFTVLLWPPYGDAASGPLVEAIWLARNHFDFVALNAQRPFLAGGPKVYLFSIYPVFMALLMKTLVSPRLFILVNHLLVFLLSAYVVAFFRNMVDRFDGKTTALLSAFVLLALPLFQSQVEQINMEMPMLFFVSMSAMFLTRRQCWRASFAAIAAAMVKGVAICICAAVFVLCILFFLLDDKLRFKKHVLAAGLLALVFVILKYLGAFYILNKDGSASMVGFLMGWPSMRASSTFFVYLMSAVMIFINLFMDKIKGKMAWTAVWAKNYIAVVMLVFTTGWFALFAHSQGLQPRYWLLMTPFNLFGIVYIVRRWVRSEKLFLSIMISGIVFGCICSYGLLNDPVVFHSHSALERTLEYRNDMIVHRYMAKRLEERYADYTIGAPLTFAQTLALPELGYISKKLDVMIYQFPCTYGIRTFNSLAELNLSKTLYVGVKTDPNLPKELKDMLPYPMGHHDKILEVLSYGDRDITLFMGGESIQKMRILRYQMLKVLREQGKIKP